VEKKEKIIKMEMEIKEILKMMEMMIFIVK
jgi:hypothetical protein